MKKLIVIAFFCIGFSSLSFGQAGKETTTNKGNFITRLFSRQNKPRAQMKHFENAPRDPKLKHNSTAFFNSHKSKYVTDGDGFAVPNLGNNRRRNKKTGIK